MKTLMILLIIISFITFTYSAYMLGKTKGLEIGEIKLAKVQMEEKQFVHKFRMLDNDVIIVYTRTNEILKIPGFNFDKSDTGEYRGNYYYSQRK